MGKYERIQISAMAAAAKVNSGDVVYVTGGPTQPAAFLEALGARTGMHDVTVYSTYTLLATDAMVRQALGGTMGGPRHPTFRTFLVGPGEREAAKEGAVEFVPCSAADIPDLFRRERIDVVVIGCAAPKEDGTLNFSCSCGFTRTILENAKAKEALILAEVNPQLPYCFGDTSFPVDDVDYIVLSDHAVNESPTELAPGQEAHAIGGFIAGLVPDGATLHIGLGSLVARSVTALECKRNLGVHSEYIGEAILTLWEKGAVTSAEKTFMPGMWVGSYAAGSRRLYNYIDKNDSVQIHSLDFVARIKNISRNKKMVSITQASQVDLTGQVAILPSDYDSHSYLGVQHAFHRGAALSEGGMGILVLPAQPPDSACSNIVSRLDIGATVVIPSYDVDIVVTEHGVARLKGKSRAQRALDLIAVSPPATRPNLMAQARKQGLL